MFCGGDFEWRAGFREDGLSIAGFLKDNRPAGSFVPDTVSKLFL